MRTNDNAGLVRPFAALRPAPGRAADVAAPPYDVMNGAEARQLAAGKPWSFLHVSRAEIDLPESTSPYDPAVYAKAAENLTAMIRQGILVRDPKPCYYAYRVRMGTHSQTGIAGAGSIAAYEANRIRRHEFTRPDKEDDRVRQIEALNAQTGPVMVTHRADSTLAQILAKVVAGEPVSQVTAESGVIHTVWMIDDDADIAAINAAFDAMNAIYIADGHHRSASASRVARARALASGDKGSRQPHDYFLIVSFPDDEVQILDYNRAVRDLNGHDVAGFLAAIAGAFDVEPSARACKPDQPGRFGMYLDGRWYRLTLNQPAPPDDPVAALDISLLSARLLGPVLAIGDPRLDKRIDFIGGIRGLAELERRVDSGEMAVAFSLFATSLADLMAVADANEVMPPKSTWFEPKLADGLLSLVLD
ncbi:MAG: DUF1015 domain-containing protein [Rhodospirillales bacterium]|nr:DUF1015 domain-containing protein [Rhodospirillales bacterium]